MGTCDPTPSPQNRQFISPEQVVEQIPAEGQLIIVIDKDGTLDPKIPDRDAAFVDAGVVHSLMRLHQAPDITVAVVSGRSVEGLKRLVGEHPLTYYGLHGAEKGKGDSFELEASLPAELGTWIEDFEATFRANLEKLGVDPSVHSDICENKERKAFGAHWRPHPELTEQILKAFSETWEGFAHQKHFEVQPGDHVIEMKPPGGKGAAVEDLLKQHPEAHVVVMGDDKTDLDMMRAARHQAKTSTCVIVENREIAASGACYLKSPEEVAIALRLLADKREPAL